VICKYSPAEVQISGHTMWPDVFCPLPSELAHIKTNDLSVSIDGGYRFTEVQQSAVVFDRSLKVASFAPLQHYITSAPTDPAVEFKVLLSKPLPAATTSGLLCQISAD